MQGNLFTRCKNSAANRKICEVLCSYKIIPVCAAISFLSSVIGLELPVIIVASLVATYVILFCPDVRPVFLLFFTGVFSISRKGVKGGQTIIYSPVGKAMLVSVLGLIVVSFTIRIIVYKEWKAVVRGKYKMKWGLLAIALSFFVAGAFSKEYKPVNLVIALANAASFSLLYFYVSATRKCDKNDLDYLSYVVCAFLLNIILQLAAMYLIDRATVFDEQGKIIRENIDLGWAGHNSVGTIICMMLPFAFYNAYTKKYGYGYTVLALLAVGGTVLTMSRMSIIVAAVGFIAGAIYLLINGNYRKINVIIFSVLGAIIVVGIIVFRNKIYSLFESILSLGFALNGREGVYKRGLNDFFSAPIFGVGYSLSELNGVWEKLFYFGKYHNLVIEIFATSGVFGAICFGVFFVCLIRVIRGKVDAARFALILAACLFLLDGMAERVFFIPGLNTMFMLFVTFMEKYVSEPKNNSAAIIDNNRQ